MVKNIKFKKINNDFFIRLNSLSGQALHAKTLGFIHPKKRNGWILIQNCQMALKKY